MKSKRYVAWLLVLVMLISTLVACGSGGNETAGGDEAPKYKIGCIIYGKEDSLGSMCYSLLNSAAAALGCEVTFAMGSYDASAQIADAENLISSGVDGLLVLPLAENASQRIGAICEENKIPWAIMFRTVSDESIRAELEASEYFIGNILGDDAGNAEEVARIAAEKFGMKKVCVIYSPEGSSNALRNDGFLKGMETYGMTQLAESTPSGGDMSTVSNMIQTFITTNPDMDGILCTTGATGIGETMISTLDQMAPDNVKLAIMDTFSGMEEAFESGRLAVVCGGQAPISLFTFIMLYNAMDGHRLADTPQELQQKYIFVTDAEECALFDQYIVNPEHDLYSAEEIRQMTVRYNPDFTMDSLLQVMEDCNLENLASGLAS